MPASASLGPIAASAPSSPDSASSPAPPLWQEASTISRGGRVQLAESYNERQPVGGRDFTTGAFQVEQRLFPDQPLLRTTRSCLPWQAR